MIKWLLSRAVEDDNVANGYDLVYTPNVTREELFKISGHLPLYAANQYPPMAAGAGEAEDVRYRVKPMNCPMHALIYKSQQRSYRDLPIRLSEVANVYRNEKSGTLHGLLRVRGLSMDDAHIFCTMDQVEDEIFLCLDQVDRLVRADVRLRAGLRGLDPAGGAAGRRRDLGPGRGDAAAGAGAEGDPVPDRRGRRRVLRAQDRHQVPRRDRPDVAGAHDPARLQPARAVRAGVHRRRTTGRTGR